MCIINTNIGGIDYMEKNWDLTALYPSFEDESFSNDLKKLDAQIEKLSTLKDTIGQMSAKELVENYIQTLIDLRVVADRLGSYVSLTLSANTSDALALKYSDQIDQVLTQVVEPTTILEKAICSIEHLDDVIESSALLKTHAYLIEEMVANNHYTLTPSEENIIANMKNTGSNAWAKLKDQLIAGHTVEMDGEELPLTVVLNKAYDPRSEVRKEAYEKEIASYVKIEQGVAACLNGIKGEVLTECKLRGYTSPLEKTLISSRMSQKTLDTMLEAMQESLPKFREYLKAKAKYLGHQNGLPFYDLYAPVSNADMEFDYEKGGQFVVKQFRTFSDHLADFASQAISKNWIDVYPKAGKVGGAFCSNLHFIKESRFLLNYGNSFNDVVTLAHELGHGFHGECLKNETILNADYPMPIAETASTFCETIIKKAALKQANKQEALAILETEISGCNQVVVDIYSRFLFEKNLFERRKEGALSVEEIKELMLQAQRDSYGDGLDPNYLHPYMWTWKPHYYYASSNFYNFPYAFGLLLAKGLYALYLEKGPSFALTYEKFLSKTGQCSLEDVAMSVGIDLTKKSFWQNSLKMIEEDIDTFIELINE